MLVISRKNGQKIIINDNIIITVAESRNGQCKIAIEADKDVKIYREEIYYQVKLANLIGKSSNVQMADSVSALLKNNSAKLNDNIEKTEDNKDIILDESTKSIVYKKNQGKKS